MVATDSITPDGSVLISSKSFLALMTEAMWKTKVVQRGSQMQHVKLFLAAVRLWVFPYTEGRSQQKEIKSTTIGGWKNHDL